MLVGRVYENKVRSCSENLPTRPRRAQNRIKVGKPKRVNLTKQALNSFFKKQAYILLSYPFARLARGKPKKTYEKQKGQLDNKVRKRKKKG